MTILLDECIDRRFAFALCRKDNQADCALAVSA